MEAPPTEHRIHAGGVILAAEESGEGLPIVLLHGLTATRRYVVMGARSLQRTGHRVIAYDARRRGLLGAVVRAVPLAQPDPGIGRLASRGRSGACQDRH